MAENTIEIKLTSDQQPAGGGSSSPPPAGSSGGGGGAPAGSSDRFSLTAGNQQLVADLMEGRISEEEFRNRMGGGGGGGKPPDAGGVAGGDDEEEQERRNRVLSGLARQRVREEERQRKEDERQREKDERELNADLKRQFREQERERNRAERELNADLKRQYRQQQQDQREYDRQKAKFAKEAEREKKKAEKEDAAAERDRRQQWTQFGTAAQQIAGAKTAAGVGSGLLNMAGTGFLGKEAAGLANGPMGGPIAAGLALYEAAQGLIKRVGAGFREGIQGAGEVGKGLINNDPAAIVNSLSEGVAGFLEKTGLAGTVLAEGIRTATAAANTFGEVVDAAAKRAKELEGFDAGIAGATAMAEVRRLQADIAEAQRNSDSYASIVDSQSRLEMVGRQVMDPLKDAFLEVLADVAEDLADIAEDVKPILKFAAKVTAILLKGEAAMATFPLKLLGRLIEVAPMTVLFKALFGDEEEPADLLDEIRKTVEGIRRGDSLRTPQENQPDKGNKKKKPFFFGG